MLETNKNYFADIELLYAAKLQGYLYEYQKKNIVSICFRHNDDTSDFILFRPVGSRLCPHRQYIE